MATKDRIRIAFRFLSFFCFLFIFESLTGTVVRFVSVKHDVPFMFSKYAFLVWFLISKRKMKAGKALLCPIIFFVFIIPGLSYIFDGEISALGLPNEAMALLGCFYGYLIAKRKANVGVKILIPLLVALFSVWYIFGKGFDHWCQLLDGDTFTGKVKPANVALNWKVYNKHKDTFTSEAYKDKVVYLDFWSTSCGVCFIKFPELEKLYQKYKNDNRVLIQAVNIPLERDTAGMAFYMIERKNKYNFPVVVGNDVMKAAFKIEFYPTVVILKNNKMVFRGRTELAADALEDILEEQPAISAWKH